MKWPWTQSPPETAGTDARKAATEHLGNQLDQWPEVTRVSKSLRELRLRNHFGDQIELTLQGGHKR